MITVGGMIGGTSEKRRIRGSELTDTFYYRASLRTEPCVITVPLLTRKERQHLDGFMPSEDSWIPEDFEMSSELVLAYRDILPILSLICRITTLNCHVPHRSVRSRGAAAYQNSALTAGFQQVYLGHPQS